MAHKRRLREAATVREMHIEFANNARDRKNRPKSERTKALYRQLARRSGAATFGECKVPEAQLADAQRRTSCAR